MAHFAVADRIELTRGKLSDAVIKRRILKLASDCNFYGLNFGGRWMHKVLAAYCQPHRHFHTLEHLLEICEGIRERHWDDRQFASELLLTALFHDIVWFPQRRDNEARSVEAFQIVMASLGNPLPENVMERVSQTILATHNQEKTSRMATIFNELDCNIIIHGSPVDLLAYEYQIFKEFQYLNVTEYRKGRSAFFTRFARRFPECRQNMRFLVEFLERRRPRVGIYAGTFNPFHIGHLSILEKAEMMFDKVIVAIGINPEKHSNLQPQTQLGGILPFHEVISFATLMVDLVERESALSDVTLVRGLRNGYDLDYEMNQLCFMQGMRPSIQVVYIPCDKNLEHISSSALKGLAIFDVKGRDSIYYPNKYNYFQKSLEELFG